MWSKRLGGTRLVLAAIVATFSCWGVFALATPQSPLAMPARGQRPGPIFTIATDASGDGWSTVRSAGGLVGRAVRAPSGEGTGVAARTDDPASAVQQLFAAYALRDRGLCGAILTHDFLFTSDDPAFAAAWPNGMTREDEQRFIEHLANGVTKDGHTLPPVNGIAIAIGSMDVAIAADGLHAHVVAHDVQSRMTTAEGMLMESDEDLTFELVRVVALEVHERPLAIGSWRVRRWDERTLASDAAPNAAAVAAAAISRDEAPVRLAMQRVSGPREWPVRLELAIPRGAEAELEVFDVAGRVILDRRLPPAGSSSVAFTLDDRSMAAGVYFARARAAGQVVTSKLVVLR